MCFCVTRHFGNKWLLSCCHSSLFIAVWEYYSVEEYIASDRDKIILDPDPSKIFTKQKARECSIPLADSSTRIKDDTIINYPISSWGKALDKLPLFTKAEMKNAYRKFW